MIDIKLLKNNIENNLIGDGSYIFCGKSKNSRFIMLQYLNEISKLLNLDIQYQDSFALSNNNLFGLSSSDCIKVFIYDEFELSDLNFLNEKYYYVLTNKLSDNTKDLFNNIIAEFPNLETWQIKDYVFSNLQGIDNKKLEWLCNICNNDIYLLFNEVDRFKLFDVVELPYIFNDFINDGGYSQFSDKNIFNFTDAIIHKRIDDINSILVQINSIDIEPIGLLTVLINNF